MNRRSHSINASTCGKEDTVGSGLPPPLLEGGAREGARSLTLAVRSALRTTGHGRPSPALSAPYPSWPGLSRPSMSSLVKHRVQDVDARHKGEHVGGGSGDNSPINPRP
ncbi:hypothetical protein B6S44_21185 [Bosea sp. Tri-44]|nr:hypothetical protein B6S44_21185 [Bosea sp. Tri-44]